MCLPLGGIYLMLIKKKREHYYLLALNQFCRFNCSKNNLCKFQELRDWPYSYSLNLQNKYFYSYRDDNNLAANLVTKGEKEELQRLCVNQVSSYSPFVALILQKCFSLTLTDQLYRWRKLWNYGTKMMSSVKNT